MNPERQHFKIQYFKNQNSKTNTLKAINDIKIDISILTSLMAQNDEYYEFYNNKLTYLKNELNYLNQKKLYIERMLRK